MTETTDIVRLLQSLVRVEVDQFDAVDARVRRDGDIALIELLPLRVIARTPDCRVQDLADALGISVGGASKSVDRLARRDWVRRAPHPGDRRSSVLELTAAGRRAAADGDRIAADELRGRLAAVLGGDLSAFDALLARLDPTR